MLNLQVLTLCLWILFFPMVLADVACPSFGGFIARCNGCQYCPDGSICPNCILPTKTPSASPVVSPTVASDITAYVKCPYFEGVQKSCNGCQYCPDGSICPNCVLPPRNPSASPVAPPVVSQVTPVQKCPYYAGTQTSCNGCQYCPDGSLCPNCIRPAVTVITTQVPTIATTSEPSIPTTEITVTSEPTMVTVVSTAEPTVSTMNPTLQSTEVTIETTSPTPEPTIAAIIPVTPPTPEPTILVITDIPTILPTETPSFKPTRKAKPTRTPTYAPTVKPTRFTCPLYKGQRVICTGCKTCPDGSLCPNCAIKVKSNSVDGITDSSSSSPSTTDDDYSEHSMSDSGDSNESTDF